eukprot:9470922-Pyramimonas_sp.AAC.1
MRKCKLVKAQIKAHRKLLWRLAQVHALMKQIELTIVCGCVCACHVRRVRCCIFAAAGSRLFRELAKVQRNLCFTQTKMERALGRVASAKTSKVKLNTSQLDDWKTKVAKRIRTMCCHVQMAWTRAPGPATWL